MDLRQEASRTLEGLFTGMAVRNASGDPQHTVRCSQQKVESIDMKRQGPSRPPVLLLKCKRALSSCPYLPHLVMALWTGKFSPRHAAGHRDEWDEHWPSSRSCLSLEVGQGPRSRSLGRLCLT